jgi:D-arginine dehydrogenase
VETTQGTIAAAIVVNAAGAWAGKIAGLVGALPIQITAKRRTAFLFQPPDIPALMDSAMTIDIDEMFYFKPEAGLMLGSPADETPMQPQDIQADEWDIAVGADRVQQAADLPIKRIERSWAGLRSFADDKTPVLGFDPSCPGFFWLAGQGGYGIQMAAAMGGLAASTILGQRMPSALEALDFNPAEIAPDRFL